MGSKAKLVHDRMPERGRASVIARVAELVMKARLHRCTVLAYALCAAVGIVAISSTLAHAAYYDRVYPAASWPPRTKWREPAFYYVVGNDIVGYSGPYHSDSYLPHWWWVSNWFHQEKHHWISGAVFEPTTTAIRRYRYASAEFSTYHQAWDLNFPYTIYRWSNGWVRSEATGDYHYWEGDSKYETYHLYSDNYCNYGCWSLHAFLLEMYVAYWPSGLYLLYQPMDGSYRKDGTTHYFLVDDYYYPIEIARPSISLEVDRSVAQAGTTIRMRAHVRGWPDHVAFTITGNGFSKTVGGRYVGVVGNNPWYGELEEWEAVWEIPVDLPSGQYTVRAVPYYRAGSFVSAQTNITIQPGIRGACAVSSEFIWSRPGDSVTFSCVDQSEGGRISGGTGRIGDATFVMNDDDGDGVWTGQFKAPANPGMYDVTARMTAENGRGAVVQFDVWGRVIVVGDVQAPPPSNEGLDVVDVTDGGGGGVRASRVRLVR